MNEVHFLMISDDVPPTERRGQYIFYQEENQVLQNIPIIDMVKTGQNIMNLRMQAGLSVKDLQDIFGFATPQAIYKWQHGTAMPAIDNLVVLAAVFQVHLDDILVLEVDAQGKISA